MKSNTQGTSNQEYNEKIKLFLLGLALFCCFVLIPILGSLMLSLKISSTLAFIFVIFCTNILPLIIIAIGFQNINPAKSILVVFLSTGIFRVIADILISPIPYELITAPVYLINIAIYCILLCTMAVGVSLLNTRKRLALGIIVIGIILYFLFILDAFFIVINLLSGGYSTGS